MSAGEAASVKGTVWRMCDIFQGDPPDEVGPSVIVFCVSTTATSRSPGVADRVHAEAACTGPR